MASTKEQVLDELITYVHDMLGTGAWDTESYGVMCASSFSWVLGEIVTILGKADQSVLKYIEPKQSSPEKNYKVWESKISGGSGSGGGPKPSPLREGGRRRIFTFTPEGVVSTTQSYGTNSNDDHIFTSGNVHMICTTYDENCILPDKPIP